MDANYLSEVNKLISNKKFEEAELILSNITRTEENVEAIKLLGLCYVNLNETQKAIETFEKVVKADPTDATSWFYLATMYDNLDNTDRAEQCYLKVIKLRDAHEDSYKNLTILYLKMKAPQKALKYAEKYVELSPLEYQGYYILGTINIALHNPKDGIENFEKALGLCGENASIMNSLGVAYFSVNRLDDATNMLTMADTLEPNNPITNYNLGNIFQIKRDYEKAFKHFQVAYTNDPTTTNLSALAYSALKAEKYDDAIMLYKTLTVICPDKQNFQYNLACAYIRAKKMSEAISILKKLVVQNPKSGAMAEKLADIYVSIGEYEDAKLIYDLLIRKGKVSAETYYRYAIICMKANDKDKAIQILKKVLTLNPENAIAHKDLGVIYLSQRLFDYAKDEFELALKYDPDSPVIAFEYANFLYSTTDYIGAKALYEKIINMDKDNTEFWFYKGLNHLALNELNQAQYSFKRSVELQKNDVNTYHLARANYHLNNFEEAKELLNTLLVFDIDAKNLMALTHYQLGEYNEVVEIYNKILEEYHENVNIMLSLAKCHLKLKNKEEALKCINETLERFSDHEEANELLKEAQEL